MAVPLSVGHDRQLDDVLAGGHVHAGPGGRAGPDRLDDARPPTSRSAPRGVHGDAGRLLLQPDARRCAGQLAAAPGPAGCAARPSRARSARRSRRRTRSRGCRPGGPRSGSRDSAARSRSARPEITATVVCGSAASDRIAATASGSGARVRRVVDDRRERAVVVAGDQQLRARARRRRDRAPAGSCDRASPLGDQRRPVRSCATVPLRARQRPEGGQEVGAHCRTPWSRR